jgi:hypothetical protein
MLATTWLVVALTTISFVLSSQYPMKMRSSNARPLASGG